MYIYLYVSYIYVCVQPYQYIIEIVKSCRNDIFKDEMKTNRSIYTFFPNVRWSLWSPGSRLGLLLSRCQNNKWQHNQELLRLFSKVFFFFLEPIFLLNFPPCEMLWIPLTGHTANYALLVQIDSDRRNTLNFFSFVLFCFSTWPTSAITLHCKMK